MGIEVLTKKEKIDSVSSNEYDDKREGSSPNPSSSAEPHENSLAELSLNNPAMELPSAIKGYIEKQEGQNARHRSEYPWLFGKNDAKGVRWGHNPVYLRNVSDQETIFQMARMNIARELSNTSWEIVEDDDSKMQKDPSERKGVEKADGEGAEKARKLFRQPNEDQDLSDILYEMITDQLTIGPLSVVLSFDKSDYKGDVLDVPDVDDDRDTQDLDLIEMKTHDPVTFNKKYDKNGRLEGFYQFATGRTNTSSGVSKLPESIYFDKHEIVWDDINPMSHRAYGYPPTLMALPYIELASLTIEQEINLFASGMIAQGALVFEELDANEVDDLMEEVNQNMKGKPEERLVLGGDGGSVENVDFSYNYEDLQYHERQVWYAKVLASVLQVPLSMVGLNPEEVNRATFQGKREDYESSSLGPHMTNYERVFTNQIVKPFFGEDLRFQFTPGQSETQRAKISNRVMEQYKEGIISRQEARKELGKDVLDEGEPIFNDSGGDDVMFRLEDGGD